MSARSLKQASLASRLIDVQANQRFERDIEAVSEHNEMLAADIATLTIDEMSPEGEVSAAREEVNDIQQ